jgi:hypothetical protein
VEASLLSSHERAGVGVFLFDTVTEDGRVARFTPSGSYVGEWSVTKAAGNDTAALD